ncbi:YraN family protein [Mycobacterium senriense]
MVARPVGGAGHGAPMTTETTMTRIQLGAMGEALAVDYLMRMGLRILQRNWRCRYGELDIIARDDATSTVVFVEVKTRTGDGYGGLAHAVTPRKVLRLRRLAGLWLAGQEQRCAAIRIDVIGVRVGRRRTPEITHLQGVG